MPSGDSHNRTQPARGAGVAQTARERGLRVLMIAPTSFFADYGCHVRILEEARILQQLGQHVTIVTYRNGGPVPGLDIRRTLPIPWRRHYEVGSSRHKIAFDMLLGLKTLELLLRERFDVIHAHLHEGAAIGHLLGRLAGVPMVFDYQGSMTGEMLDHHFISRTGRAYRPLLRLESWLDQVAPIVFTSSDHAARLLLDEFGCCEDRVVALPDCVNAAVFKPASAYAPGELASLRAALGIPPDRKLIVYLGLLAEYQGTGRLLEAMQMIRSQHEDAHLLLMGFPSVDDYRRRARELGIEDAVTFTGRVPYADAPMHLALGNVAVAPKLSLTEGSGKLLNYMAIGLPVVAYDTPVAREYLGSDGVLATCGDVTSLAEGLEHCLYPPANDPLLYQRLGWRLRQRAIQQFGWEKAGQEIIAAYRRARGEPAGSAADERKPSLAVVEK